MGGGGRGRRITGRGDVEKTDNTARECEIKRKDRREIMRAVAGRPQGRAKKKRERPGRGEGLMWLTNEMMKRGEDERAGDDAVVGGN